MKIGENNLSHCEEQLKTFLDRIDEYIENKNLSAQEYSDDFREAERLSLDNIRQLNQDDCFNYGLMLYNYADHINSERSRQESVIHFCD